MFRYLFLFICSISSAHAIALYSDLGLTSGYSGISIGSGLEQPNLGVYGSQITLGLMGAEFGLGVASDFRYTSQYTSVNPAVGNFAGYRWNPISPVFFLREIGMLFRLEVEWMGTYYLRYRTAQKESVNYEMPRGLRLGVLFPALGVKRLIVPGLFFEYLRFTKQWSSFLGTRITSSPVVMWQVGISLSLVYDGEKKR